MPNEPVVYLLDPDRMLIPTGTVEMVRYTDYLELKRELEAAKEFKKFVHRRFDEIGVPKEFPDGVHSKEGCRVGDRIDWIEARLPHRLSAQKNSSNLRAVCDVLSQMLRHVPGTGEAILSMEKGDPGSWREGDLFLRWRVTVPVNNKQYGISHIIDRYATKECIDGTALLADVIESCGRKLKAGIPR